MAQLTVLHAEQRTDSVEIIVKKDHDLLNASDLETLSIVHLLDKVITIDNKQVSLYHVPHEQGSEVYATIGRVAIPGSSRFPSTGANTYLSLLRDLYQQHQSYLQTLFQREELF